MKVRFYIPQAPTCVCGAVPGLYDRYQTQEFEFRCPNNCRYGKGSTPEEAMEAWTAAVDPHQMD